MKHDTMSITKEEAKALLDWIDHEYINQEYETLHKFIRRVTDFVREK